MLGLTRAQLRKKLEEITGQVLLEISLGELLTYLSLAESQKKVFKKNMFWVKYFFYSPICFYFLNLLVWVVP